MAPKIWGNLLVRVSSNYLSTTIQSHTQDLGKSASFQVSIIYLSTTILSQDSGKSSCPGTVHQLSTTSQKQTQDLGKSASFQASSICLSIITDPIKIWGNLRPGISHKPVHHKSSTHFVDFSKYESKYGHLTPLSAFGKFERLSFWTKQSHPFNIAPSFGFPNYSQVSDSSNQQRLKSFRCIQ